MIRWALQFNLWVSHTSTTVFDNSSGQVEFKVNVLSFILIVWLWQHFLELFTNLVVSKIRIGKWDEGMGQNVSFNDTWWLEADGLKKKKHFALWGWIHFFNILSNTGKATINILAMWMHNMTHLDILHMLIKCRRKRYDVWETWS